MSEQQSQPDRPTDIKQDELDDELDNDLWTGYTYREDGPDDSEPTPEQQAWLRARYEENLAADRAPYVGVVIWSRGELNWVMHERRWAGTSHLMPDGHEKANLSGAIFNEVGGIHANLSEVDLSGANLSGAEFTGANLSNAWLERADLSGANLDITRLSGAQLGSADLSGASLRWANLSGAHLVNTKLHQAEVNGADLRGAELTGARMDSTTDLRDARLDTQTLLADVVWNGTPLTRLNWSDVAKLGDEQAAHDPLYPNGSRKPKSTRLLNYTNAVLANRQVATALRSQGINEHADRFAYRAQLCQCEVLRLQVFLREKGRRVGPIQQLRKLAAYLGSGLLDLIAGYGYRPLRSFATYLLVVTVFGLAYWALGLQTGHTLTWNEAGVVSLTAFHGRGFFATAFQPGDPQAAVAALEAVFGLLIEITFIATFTQRFFAR